ALQDAAAAVARRILFAGPKALEHRLHRPAPAALHAHHVAHRAVHLDDLVGRAAGLLVQAVDILRDQREELVAALERDEPAMAGIRLGTPCWMIEPAFPRQLPDFGIRHVRVDVREPLGLWISGPEPLRATKIRDAGLSGDAGAGQRDDATGCVNPAANGLD